MKLSSLVSGLVTTGAVGMFTVASGCSTDTTTESENLGSAESALTEEQCSYFDINGTIQICHQLGNGKFKILRLNEQACINAHGNHATDYVTSTNPSSPLYDPTCQGNGCLPEGAPCDATLPCCEGTCTDGVCSEAGPPEIVSFSVAAENNTVDRATWAVDNAAVGPDGSNDGVFNLVVKGQVKAVEVLFANADNTCWMTGQWDTVVGSTSLLPNLTCGGYQLGSDTFGLAVSDDGGATILNGATGALPTLGSGTHSLKLYLPGTQYGKYYQSRVQFADDSVLVSSSAVPMAQDPSTCAPWESYCGIACVYVYGNDVNNCGACDAKCEGGPGTYCSSGYCYSY